MYISSKHVWNYQYLPLDNSNGVAIGDDDGTKTTSLKIGDDADLILSYDGTTGVEVSFIESNALILEQKLRLMRTTLHVLKVVL